MSLDVPKGARAITTADAGHRARDARSFPPRITIAQGISVRATIRCLFSGFYTTPRGNKSGDQFLNASLHLAIVTIDELAFPLRYFFYRKDR